MWLDKHFLKPFATGVTAFMPTKAGEAARRVVRATYGRLDAPAPVRMTLEALGPPTTGTEAAVSLGLASIGGLGIAKATSTVAAKLAPRVVASLAAKNIAATAAVGAGLGLLQPARPAPGPDRFGVMVPPRPPALAWPSYGRQEPQPARRSHPLLWLGLGAVALVALRRRA
jgi:hypothetical protein